MSEITTVVDQIVNAAGAFTPEAVSAYLASKAVNSIVTGTTESALIKYEDAIREVAPFMKHLGRLPEPELAHEFC